MKTKSLPPLKCILLPQIVKPGLFQARIVMCLIPHLDYFVWFQMLVIRKWLIMASQKSGRNRVAILSLSGEAESLGDTAASAKCVIFSCAALSLENPKIGRNKALHSLLCAIAKVTI